MTEPRQHSQRLLARNIALLEEGWRAVRALEEARIPAVLLKGAALIDVIYAPGERPMEDVDVLVPRRALERAHAALVGVGFRPVDVGRPLDRRTRHARPYLSPRGHHVDLHGQIAYPGRWRVDHDALFRRAVALAGPDGRPGRRLANEDHLLVIALAEANDELCANTYRIEDVRRIAGGLPIDWDALCERARRAGCAIALWLTLRRARDSAGAAIPDRAIAALAPRAPRRLYLERLFDPAKAPAYRFSGQPKRVRQLVAGPALTDAPWRFAAMIARLAAVRLADRVARGRVT